MSPLQLFQAEPLTAAHRWVGAAAILGALFVILHIVTVAITCTVAGFDWGFNAWFFDIAGFLAGAFFAVQCRISSNTSAHQFKDGNRWILLWAFATCCVRVLDTLMLLGIVKWNAIYETPSGAVFWSNFVSEIIVGFAYSIAALIGATLLLQLSKRSLG